MEATLEKEILTQLHAVQKKQDMTLEAVHKIDMKSDRALLVAVETQTNLNMVKRDINRIPETCPGRARLDEHLKTHDTASRGKLNGWQKTAITGALVTGLGTLIFNLAQAIFVNTGINP